MPARRFLPVLMPLPSRHVTIVGAIGWLGSPVVNIYCNAGPLVSETGGMVMLTDMPGGKSETPANAGGRLLASNHNSIVRPHVR
jgi:hypothetical protein